MPEKIKLLIVDDEIKFLDSIAQRLELRDFQVTKASNGAQAIEAGPHRLFRFGLVGSENARNRRQTGAGNP